MCLSSTHGRAVVGWKRLEAQSLVGLEKCCRVYEGVLPYYCSAQHLPASTQHEAIHLDHCDTPAFPQGYTKPPSRRWPKQNQARGVVNALSKLGVKVHEEQIGRFEGIEGETERSLEDQARTSKAVSKAVEAESFPLLSPGIAWARSALLAA